MHHPDHHTSTSIKAAKAAAFVAGAAAGVAAGILLAPRSGKETRARLKDKAEDARRKAAAKLDQEKAMLHDKADEAVDAVRDLTTRGQETAEEVQERVRKAGRNASREL